MSAPQVETDPRAIARYRDAVLALTAADRLWLRSYGWCDNSPKPYPKHGFTREHFEPLYVITGAGNG